MSERMSWRRGIAAASLVSVALLTVGCAQDVGDIDRTQPNKLSKADFTPDREYYYRQQVVDTDVQGSVIFQGLMGDLHRIRWEVTENTLFACSTVAPVQGEREEEQFINGRECHGIVAAFPITGHFDVQRQYNTATGEQSNLIVENVNDRPWYDREFMRVDWSTNLIDNSIPLGSTSYQLEPTDYGQSAAVGWNPDQDPGYADPNRTRVNVQDEGYLETTTLYNYDPDYYACWALSGNPFRNCEGGRVAIRHSFLEVPDQKTFEPFRQVDTEYIREDNGDPILATTLFDQGSGYQAQVQCNDYVAERIEDRFGSFSDDRCRPLTFDYFQRFGYFRTENVDFSLEYGVVDRGRQYWANHFNIWRSAYSADGEELDMAERTPEPIVYHLNAEYPRDMVDAAKEVERQWDIAFASAVAVAQDKDIEDVRAELSELYDGDTRMFKIEENGCMPSQLAPWVESPMGDARESDRANVRDMVAEAVKKGNNPEGANLEDQLWGMPIEGLKQLCSDLEYATDQRPKGERFVWQREGDLRHSFFSWVEENNMGWLGYGPSAADPLTGEIISGGANIAGTSIRTSSYVAADRVLYMLGELDEQELSFGTHVHKHLQDAEAVLERTTSQELNGAGEREFAQRANHDTGLTPDEISKSGFADRPALDELPDAFYKYGAKGVQQRAAVMAKSAVDAHRADTRFLDLLSNPQVKSMMLADPQMNMTVEAVAQTMAPGRALTEEDRHLAYLQLNAPMIMSWRMRERSRFLAEHNILSTTDFMQAIDSLITYEGVVEAFRGQSRDEIAEYFRDNMMIGTQLHEVGHTVGLRHNFNASMDVLNYHDEYWLIHKAVAEGRITRDQASKLGREEAREILGAEWVMEENVKYLNEAEFRLASVMDYTADLTGRFAGLGKYDQASINFVYAQKVQTWDDDLADKLPNGLSFELWLASPEELPLLFTDKGVDVPENERVVDGINNILNGRKWVSIEKAREHLRQSVLTNTSNLENKQFSRSAKPMQDLAVPYNFCTDDRSDFELGCTVFDWGSSHREIVNHAFNTYRVLQPFYRHRRGRLHENMETINNYYRFIIRSFLSASRPFRFFSIYKLWDLGSYTDDLREAAIDAANFYAETLAMPEPGVYCKFEESDKSLRWSGAWNYNLSNAYLPATADYAGNNCDEPIRIQEGMAQYYGYDLSQDYAFRVNYVGTFIDKIAASQLLFSISANYLYNSFLTDTRATNVSYWTLFKDEMIGVLRGTILGDHSQFGGVFVKKGGGEGNYEPPTMINRDAFTHGVDDPQKGQPRVYTNISFNHEFNMLAYALITNSTWQDRHTDFAQYVRVAVGDRKAMDFGDAEIVEFVNPETGQRYVAPQTADGQSISVEMIEWANELEDRWLDAQRDMRQKQSYYDELRGDYGSNYNPRDCENEDLMVDDPDLGAVCQAMSEYEQAKGAESIRSEQLQNVIAKIDLVRWLWGALGPDALH